ncbi:PREDICTED: uncharacterized protein LOC104730984 [Camelina sativa]|uniref:Uncharacterized protein LOC104730984 n=1 Tax=Camelina sativa TaxID=90675 RepID=A0ABM0UZE2_CAMSA|nr:PREDICTED: uncharacterized protein LOC104730984 [Camelina sativa]
MCDRDHPQPSDETIFDCDEATYKSLYPLIFYKDGKTCVFWDVEDYPIPDGPDPASIYQSMKEAVKKHGCDAEVTIHAYADNNTVSDDLTRQFLDAGFEFEVFTEECKYARHCAMFCDVMLWTLENPTPSNVIVLANIIEDDFGYGIGFLSTVWSYGVLLSQPKRKWFLPIGSAPSFLTSIFDGGEEILAEAHKTIL